MQISELMEYKLHRDDNYKTTKPEQMSKTNCIAVKPDTIQMYCKNVPNWEIYL